MREEDTKRNNEAHYFWFTSLEDVTLTWKHFPGNAMCEFITWCLQQREKEIEKECNLPLQCTFTLHTEHIIHVQPCALRTLLKLMLWNGFEEQILNKEKARETRAGIIFNFHAIISEDERHERQSHKNKRPQCDTHTQMAKQKTDIFPKKRCIFKLI